jgi:hypothetical protein
MRVRTENSDSVLCDVVLVVIAAANYRNKRSVLPCQPQIDFGGGICVPNSKTEAIYREILRLRAHAFSEYRPHLINIRDACLSKNVWNFNGLDFDLCSMEYAEKVDKAIQRIDSTME